MRATSDNETDSAALVTGDEICDKRIPSIDPFGTDATRTCDTPPLAA